MTVHAPGSGVLRCVRFALALLLLSSLLAFAPAAPAGATKEECPPSELTQAEVAQALKELLALAQQYKETDTLPSQEEIDAQLAKLFDLVGYFLTYAEQLEPAQAEVLLSQMAAALEQQGLPPDQVAVVRAEFSQLLAAEGDLTAEQVLTAVVDGLRPYLLDAGYTEVEIAALTAYLVQFADDPECPDDGATPSPAPATPAAPVDNASKQPSDDDDAETSDDDSDDGSGTTTDDDSDDDSGTTTDDDTATAEQEQRVDTGVDTLLLLGLVAIAMIAGGTALSAGRAGPAVRARPARGRHQRRR